MTTMHILVIASNALQRNIDDNAAAFIRNLEWVTGSISVNNSVRDAFCIDQQQSLLATVFLGREALFVFNFCGLKA